MCMSAAYDRSICSNRRMRQPKFEFLFYTYWGRQKYNQYETAFQSYDEERKSVPVPAHVRIFGGDGKELTVQMMRNHLIILNNLFLIAVCRTLRFD